VFEDYLKENINNRDKLYYNFLGINRKEYPKWAGWKIIAKYKTDNINISDINDPELDILVRNFYYLKFIKNTLITR